MANRELLICIVLYYTVCWVSGCGGDRQARNEQVSPERSRLKLSDLQATSGDKAAEKITFQVAIYETSVEKAPSFLEAIALLHDQQLQFTDAQAFRANGFRVSFGNQTEWQRVAEKLEKARAKRLLSNMLIMFDEKGYDFATLAVPKPKSLSYFDKGPEAATVELEEGVLSLNVTATIAAEFRGVAQVAIVPVFKKMADIATARLKKDREIPQQSFDFARFSVKMSAGDFLLLGYGTPKDSTADFGPELFVTGTDESKSVRMYVIYCASVEH